MARPAWSAGIDAAACSPLWLLDAPPPVVKQFMLADGHRQEPGTLAAMISLGPALAVVFVLFALAFGL